MGQGAGGREENKDGGPKKRDQALEGTKGPALETRVGTRNLEAGSGGLGPVGELYNPWEAQKSGRCIAAPLKASRTPKGSKEVRTAAARSVKQLGGLLAPYLSRGPARGAR